MITTHSEWVLDELANLVRMSDVPKSRRKGLGGADSSLSPEQLGVWLFELRGVQGFCSKRDPIRGGLWRLSLRVR